MMIFTSIGLIVLLWIFIDFRVLGIIIINIIMINITIFGWIYICGIILDSMTFIQCLMLIGFIISYILYISYTINKYLWSKKAIIDNDISKNEEILNALISVCRSSFTTWICILPLAFADSKGFVQFFIMFTGIILIILLYAILFTAALCIELNILFHYFTCCGDTSDEDIKNLANTVAMHSVEQNKQTEQTEETRSNSTATSPNSAITTTASPKSGIDIKISSTAPKTNTTTTTNGKKTLTPASPAVELGENVEEKP